MEEKFLQDYYKRTGAHVKLEKFENGRAYYSYCGMRFSCIVTKGGKMTTLTSQRIEKLYA